LSSASVSHYWFGDPTVPLAVASAVWFSLDGRCRLRLNKPTINSALRVYLPLECYPANPSRRVATRQLLSWALLPYSTCEIEGPHHAGLPARFVPPSGFGYPLGGLLPSVSCRLSFAPAALLGFTLRSFLLSKKYPNVSARMHPPTVSQPCSRSASTKPTWLPRFLGFDLPESPWRLTCV
jgi:hypothetical protein